MFSKLSAAVFATAGLRDHHLLGKQFTTSTLVGVAVAMVMLFWAWRHARIRPVVNEVGDELVKVVWPNWEETRNHTKITIVVTAVISVILWGIRSGVRQLDEHDTGRLSPRSKQGG